MVWRVRVRGIRLRPERPDHRDRRPGKLADNALQVTSDDDSL